MVDFDHRIIPTFGLEDLVLEVSARQQLTLILNAGKTSKFISAQWGFGGAANVARVESLICLLCGKPGVGKTAVAHAIAYELGQPVKVWHVMYKVFCLPSNIAKVFVSILCIHVYVGPLRNSQLILKPSRQV